MKGEKCHSFDLLSFQSLAAWPVVLCRQKDKEIQSNGESLIKDKDCNAIFLQWEDLFRRPVISSRAVAGETGSDIGCGLCDLITPIKS